MKLVAPPLSKNCLSCASYLKCKDPHKSVLFKCGSYRAGPNGGQDAMQRLFGELELEAPARADLILPISAPIIEESDDFDIFAVVNKALSKRTLVSPDLRIDDSDFELGKNFFEFAVSDKGLKVTPFVAQALIAVRLFGEYCPRCSDNDYFDNYKVDDTYDKLRSKICFLEHGVCPSCNATQAKLYRKEKLNIYQELAVSAGQRSGKSALVAMLVAYLMHRMLKLQNPNSVYSVQRSEILRGTFVALTYAQAKETLWDPFLGNVMESPWFREYHDMLNMYQERTGEILYKLNETYITYNHRRLAIYPSGPDERTLRGRTRWLSVIDELGWFDNGAGTNKVKMGARGVYQALERSLRTLRSAAQDLWERGHTEVPTGYFLNVSSPSSVRDKIMELVRQAQGSKKILGLIRPTWEMNPKVTRKHLDEEFRIDPIMAMRDYGAQPPLTSNAFLTKGMVTPSVGDKPNFIKLVHKNKVSKKTGDTSRYAVIDKIKHSQKGSCLALDAGYVNNSFAFAVGTLDGHREPRIDIVGEIMPVPGIRLNFSRIYSSVIVPIIKARNVQLLCADRWNSLKILSDAEEELDIQTRQYSLKYSDMRLFKDYLENNQITLPNPKRTLDDILEYTHSEYPGCFNGDPIGHFYLQLLTVQDTGSSVIKGDQLTDDMVRATMLCTRMLLEDDYEELWAKTGAPEVVPQRDLASLGVSRGYSGGGSGGGSSAVGQNAMQALGVRRTRQG